MVAIPSTGTGRANSRHCTIMAQRQAPAWRSDCDRCRRPRESAHSRYLTLLTHGRPTTPSVEDWTATTTPNGTYGRGFGVDLLGDMGQSMPCRSPVPRLLSPRGSHLLCASPTRVLSPWGDSRRDRAERRFGERFSHGGRSFCAFAHGLVRGSRLLALPNEKPSLPVPNDLGDVAARLGW